MTSHYLAVPDESWGMLRAISENFVDLRSTGTGCLSILMFLTPLAEVTP